MFAYKLLLIVAATIACNTSALDIRSKTNLREGENVAVVAAKMYRHQASVQPKKGAKWEEALYHRRPSVKVPKGKSEDGGSVSLIGSGEAGERFKVECEMKICEKPSKMLIATVIFARSDFAASGEKVMLHFTCVKCWFMSLCEVLLY